MSATTRAARFSGDLIPSDDPRFDDACVDRVFNRRPTGRRPAAVLKAADEQDVVRGVRLAVERGWKVAVRSGGHSWAQWSVRDDALVLDLDALRSMSYDPVSQVVSVGPATRGGTELGPFLDKIDRFFPGGHCPTVGLGGFLLQGGQGWNARGWGWAAEYVEAVDVVTAQGDLVRASTTENADLFWAARGAGPGFFGVVTRFHLRTLPRPAYVAQTVHAYSLDDFDEVMTWLHHVHASVDPAVEIVALTKTDPDISSDPVLLVTAVALVDDADAADRALAPFRDAPALDRALLRLDAVATTLDEQRARQLEENPEGHRWAVDNAWVTGPIEDVLPAMRAAFVTLPSSKAFTIWFSMGPLRPLPDMALSLQSEIYVASYVPWREDSEDQAHEDWLAGVMRRLEPVTVGQYLGDSDLSRRQVRFMSDDAWTRLRRAREVHDPHGVFVGYLAGPDGPTNRNHWEA